jgi:hypothetical protein
MGRRYRRPPRGPQCRCLTNLVVLQEIEEEDRLWEQSRGTRSKQDSKDEEASAVKNNSPSGKSREPASEDKPKNKPPAGFY